MNIIFCYYAVNTFLFHALISNKPTPSASQPLPEKKGFITMFNLVNRAEKSQYIRETVLIISSYRSYLSFKDIKVR